MKIGRVIGTAVAGLVLFLFIGLDLALLGVVGTSSPVVTVLGLVGLLLGGVGGAAVARKRAAASPKGSLPPPPAG